MLLWMGMHRYMNEIFDISLGYMKYLLLLQFNIFDYGYFAEKLFQVYKSMKAYFLMKSNIVN